MRQTRPEIALPATGGAAGRREPSPESREKKERLNRAVDRIREKFGKKGVRPAELVAGQVRLESTVGRQGAAIADQDVLRVTALEDSELVLVDVA